jgi:flap endonuclease-1
MGLFYRTIRMVDNGIKPVYVFDGKPPDMKGGELAKRQERREETSKQLAIATDAGKQTKKLGSNCFLTLGYFR